MLEKDVGITVSIKVNSTCRATVKKFSRFLIPELLFELIVDQAVLVGHSSFFVQMFYPPNRKE